MQGYLVAVFAISASFDASMQLLSITRGLVVAFISLRFAVFFPIIAVLGRQYSPNK